MLGCVNSPRTQNKLSRNLSFIYFDMSAEFIVTFNRSVSQSVTLSKSFIMNLSVESAVPPRSVGNLLCRRPDGYSLLPMVIFCKGNVLSVSVQSVPPYPYECAFCWPLCGILQILICIKNSILNNRPTTQCKHEV